jgi:starch-binding outer membrane protein SusE/F
MKKVLLLLVVLLGNITMTNAQDFPTIGLVGAGANGWPTATDVTDIILSTADGITYTLENVALTTGSVKFRQDLAWTANWGASTFPSGVGTQNGPDIPAIAGTYSITFNRETGAYNFIAPEGSPSTVRIRGNALGSLSVLLTTQNGVDYTSVGEVYVNGDLIIEVTDGENPTVLYGGGDFPQGTGSVYVAPVVEEEVAAKSLSQYIPVQAGQYVFTFNLETKAYAFTTATEVSFAIIGIIGEATPNGWDADTMMTTTDGIVYILQAQELTTGGLKFRKDNAWTDDWGSDSFPSGVANYKGGNIPVEAGTYDISFNIFTGEFMFDASLSAASFSADSGLSVWPNPVTDGVINLSQSVDAQVYDLSGRLVAQSKGSAVNVSALSKGIYILKVGEVSKQIVIK